MKTLTLSVNPNNWQLFMRRKADPAFRRIQNKILQRDLYTCQFCGFQAREYQEIINLDQDYRNNTMSNMATACCFCAQSQFLEAAGSGDFGGGKLIHLPEMSQPELSAFCHVLFCAMINGTGYRDTAQTIYRTLKFRSHPIEDKFGAGASDPTVLGQLLIEHCSDKPKLIKQVLLPFRLLPNYAKFKKHLETWAESAAKELDKSKS